MPAKPAGKAGLGQAPGKGRASGKGKAPGKGSLKKCPICGRPASEDTLPFCSPRCRDVDLNRWLSNSYVIPAAENDDEDGE